MPRVELRVENFLAEAAAPHHAAIADAIAGSAGLATGHLTQRGLDELDAVVSDPAPALLFLCGLPYTRLRDRGAPLEPLGAPVPLGSRSGGAPVYFSDLVARAGLQATGVAGLEGALVAINDEDSLSGFVLPLAELAKRGLEGAFERTVRTGSHRRSLELLLSGGADAAPIDSTVLYLEGRREPRIADLRVVDSLGPAPSPPVVLAHGTRTLRDGLRAGLLALSSTGHGTEILAGAGFSSYASVKDADYDPVRAMDARVRALLGR